MTRGHSHAWSTDKKFRYLSFDFGFRFTKTAISRKLEVVPVLFFFYFFCPKGVFGCQDNVQKVSGGSDAWLQFGRRANFDDSFKSAFWQCIKTKPPGIKTG